MGRITNGPLEQRRAFVTLRDAPERCVQAPLPCRGSMTAMPLFHARLTDSKLDDSYDSTGCRRWSIDVERSVHTDGSVARERPWFA
jgi:hypothetical protein